MPAGIGRIGPAVAQPSQLRQVSVDDMLVEKVSVKGVLVELGVMPRTGYGSHIHQTLDAVMPQKFGKFSESAG